MLICETHAIATLSGETRGGSPDAATPTSNKENLLHNALPVPN
jgi:hypothetical protein